jgi:hypothetical protein
MANYFGSDRILVQNTNDMATGSLPLILTVLLIESSTSMCYYMVPTSVPDPLGYNVTFGLPGSVLICYGPGSRPGSFIPLFQRYLQLYAIEL